MLKKFAGLLLLTLILFICSCDEGKNDLLYEQFINPPAEARPFVRWWWNGNCVEEKEIFRELDLLKEAGIGGVEINPIRMPGNQERPNATPLTWISPQWNRMVKSACERARQNGMHTDLIVGSGWPFGGEFLQPGELVQRVIINHKELEGPSVYMADFDELLNEVPDGYSTEQQKNVVNSRILFMRLIPEKLKRLSDCVDMVPAIGKDGKIRFEVPEGKYKLFVGVWQEGHRRVTYGAPGSDGPVLDHLNAGAVQKYLDRLSTALEKEFGTELGQYLRALFCDSIELAGANWTTDFMDQFFNRCNYRLDPYLPFVFYPPEVGYRDEISIAPDLMDTLRRVRYDFNKVLVSLFLERFTTTFKTWCNDHGALCRYQAYGGPWLVGISEGYMIPDIPESNNWLNLSPHQQGFIIWNKYASSSGHIAGKSIISCEAMTNLRGVFKVPLEQIKQADDMNFITGINHSVLHGFNYSPPEAGFPGWVRYGTYFNEQNTWWPYFRYWSDYNARLSAVFQASRPSVEIAILGPTADVWSEYGLWRDPFHETPWYCYQLWKSFSQNGTSADYVDETTLQQARFKKGRLQLGKMEYEMLVLADVKSIQQATAEKIREYVKKGGKVVFINQYPGRSPSLINAEEDDSTVAALMKQILETDPGRVCQVNEPDNMDQLIPWTIWFLETMRIEPPVKISHPDQDLFQVHYINGNKILFFFSNQNEEKSVGFHAGFNTGKKIPWKWDPETGQKHQFPFEGRPDELNIKMGPLESLLLVFEDTEGPGPVPPPESGESVYRTIESEWQLKCTPHTGTEFREELPVLIDLASSSDERLNSFSGIIEYTTYADFDESMDLVLDLGKVYGVTEVFVNGKNLGVRWYGMHRYAVNDLFKQGNNEITVKLTTTLYNYCRTQSENPDIKRWLRTSDPEPSGLIGPVRLITIRTTQR